MAEFGPMNRAVGFIVAAVIAGSACGDNLGPPPLTDDQLLEKLRSIPGVSAREVGTVDGPEEEKFTYYVLRFTQPVDHDDPSKGYFQQQVSLLHRNDQAPTPMIVNTSGYSDDWGKTPAELTTMLDANQVSIEHRFYGDSKPDPVDWSYLTIKQMAKDEHDIIVALKTIYGGAFVTTGGSKGGMTAVFHRSFYPHDVAGTVAYVAPISLNAPDVRYLGKLDEIGSEPCRNAVRALATEMLARTPQFLTLAGNEGEAYSRIAVGPALEAAIAGLEWSFWQMHGEPDCTTLPGTTDSDAVLYKFLHDTSPVAAYNDTNIEYYEAYTYQMYSQLGYPAATPDYLSPYLTYKAADYRGELPEGSQPLYSRNWMVDIEDNVAKNVDQLVLIYGGWDPWTGGALLTGSYAKKYVVDHGNHKVKINDLAQDKRDAALANVAAWTGVTPVVRRVLHANAAANVRGSGRRAEEADGPELPPPLLRFAPN
jgi:PS-10 peptidase S37